MRVGKDQFAFLYDPSGGDDGTLAIQHNEEYGVTFRYKIYIKRCGGDFVQWGETGKVCDPGKDTSYEDSYAVYGPDVPSDGGASPQGIFGLSHDALLRSEWVEDDALT